MAGVKVPISLKQRMRRPRRKVDWPNEMRRSVEVRAKEAEAIERMKATVTLLRKTPQVSKGLGEASAREDRVGR